MRFTVHSLREYPYQPITDFAEARNWFLRDLPDDEFVLFTSEHEELPKMLLDYIARLEPKHPYYRIRLIRLINGRLETLWDPIYQPNLCSNRMHFVGAIHEGPRPIFGGGTIDIPMIHNSDGKHSYGERTPKWYQKRYGHLLYRVMRVYRAILWDELGRGLFRRGARRQY